VGRPVGGKDPPSSDNHDYVAEITPKPPHDCLPHHLNHKMLGIAPPKRGQNGRETTPNPSEDETTRCWGSVEVFKLVGR
jgi:hypothetical protein